MENRPAVIAEQLRVLAAPCMSVNQFNYYANISLKHNYFYMENPKVASTTTLRILQQHEDAMVAGKMANVHVRDSSPILQLSSMPVEKQIECLLENVLYKFTFVRDPYSRLLSAFLSKIEKPLPAKAEILAIIKGVDRSAIDDLSEHVDFATFVDIVCSQSSVSMNPHWKSQLDQILFNKINYTFIGKFENFRTDIKSVCARLFPGESYSFSHSANRTDSDAKLMRYYTRDLSDKVYRHFYDDFHAFEYQQHVKEKFAA